MFSSVNTFSIYKRRKTETIPVKYAVSHVRVQDDGMWVLGEKTYVNFDGSEVPMEGSKYVWLGSIFKGPGVANDSSCCTISQPLTTEPLKRLMCSLREAMKHNFFPWVLTMAGKL